VIVASDFRSVQFYLPEYRRVPYRLAPRWERGEGMPLIGGITEIAPQALGVSADADGRRYAVLYDAPLEGFLAAEARRQIADLGDG
jgi:hypothetical protein